MKKSELREMIRDVIHEELDKDDSLTEAEDITKAPYYEKYKKWNDYWEDL